MPLEQDRYIDRLRLKVRFVPVALPVEAMVQEASEGNPESRWKRINESRLHEPTS
jgi:hypothetical protein